ncbi:serine hydrolase domain-containing protein [Reyranella sp.]|jgi:CubicO group peptidase (beta-lactamase class C family)|uniref:serine hydrolase domain-containing protein n=1 Tax=Reyranella sp. TaxID=1929291 RepID=UPI00261414E6|nr:serine hydrolase domain-containing protein [Reyranella sp.]HQS17088.1 serine hydrolase domain-containing protein [Reyranella sp.]HQT15598.1 serine hydrolase domain-containing protein [Reyranella sp.]
MTQGTCRPGFERVAEAFEKNLKEKGEIGASVCLTVGGETVVDLWGGVADAKTSAPWTRDTVSIVFSCTKGATALCAHVLASRGALDLDAPVTELWPEFAQHGKERVTTRMMLDHSSAVPAVRAKVKDDGPYDWAYMTERLAAEVPFWEPGTRNGYHGFTFGWTVGEMVRRASGKSLGTFFREEIAGPLGLDFWIGLPEEIEPRVAPIVAHVYKAADAVTPFMRDLATDKESVAALFYFNNGAWRSGGANTRAGHAAEIGAANGITNARGLAGMYAPLAIGGGDLVDATTLARMAEVSMATHDDATLRIPTRFALGFMKSMDNRRRSLAAKLWGEDCDSVILGSAAFGHVGAGGSLGFADPVAGLSFGYTMNRMGPGLLMNERGQALVDAAYLSLGYKNKDGGVWVK